MTCPCSLVADACKRSRAEEVMEVWRLSGKSSRNASLPWRGSSSRHSETRRLSTGSSRYQAAGDLSFSSEITIVKCLIQFQLIKQHCHCFSNLPHCSSVSYTPCMYNRGFEFIYLTQLELARFSCYSLTFSIWTNLESLILYFLHHKLKKLNSMKYWICHIF